MSTTHMAKYLTLGKYSFGMGDRFAHQAKAQLAACQMLEGVEITPVWNKSNREHTIIGSDPSSTRAAAAAAVAQLAWSTPWHIDADHIRLETVDRFIPHSDFFTIDVADSIGKAVPPAQVEDFLLRHPELTGHLEVPGIENVLSTTKEEVSRVAGKYLAATAEAGAIYRHIAEAKGAENFITEVSMDETDSPQTPPELLVILAALADEGIPLQTIAPKFTGRFNKGVDYGGDVRQFEREFNDDLAVVAFAVKQYGLPPTLKLSVHSGSDKFSIYGPIHRALSRTGAGLHLKTAGTTWLEEIIGLAEAGGDGFDLAKEIYQGAYQHADELCAPYATVIDIKRHRLPKPMAVDNWSSGQFVAALRHDQHCAVYNPSFRQLLHVGFKIAAKMGKRYLEALEKHEAVIARNVTTNLYDRHILPLFKGL